MTNAQLPKVPTGAGWRIPALVIVCLALGVLLINSLSPQPVNPAPSQTASDSYRLVNGLIHLQTPVSGGTRRIEDYIRLARENNIGILIINDHDTLDFEYSIHALRWLVKRHIEKPSVFTYGVREYLDLFQANRSANPDMVLIDGVESTPFYYWSGSFQVNPSDRLGRRELILHSRGKHMLVAGLKTTWAYEHLPLVANGRARVDAYHGDAGEVPYQDLIDYVNQQGGVTFWAHPEAADKWSREGVLIETNAYPDAILNTVNYTGFSILSEGYQKVGRIGGYWDIVLKEYCTGKRKSPVWAVGELDDYGEKRVDSIQTVFLLKTKSYEAVLDALKTGKMYAVSQAAGKPRLVLEHFTVEDSAQHRAGYGGDEITGSGKPVIRIRLVHQGAPGAKATIKLVRNGYILREYNEALPYETVLEDTTLPAGGKSYYRLDITDEFGSQLISNPIFFASSVHLRRTDKAAGKGGMN